MARRLWLAAALLITGAVVLVVAGLGRPGAGSPSASAATDARKGGTLHLATPDDVDYVDPALGWRQDSREIGFATCAKLFNYPDAPGAAGTRLVPEVVKAFRVSRDRRTYDFELKRTFRFHTGEPVTAQSFADAFNRDANPRLNSPATGFMGEIVGIEPVMRGKAEAISGVRVLGPYRLQIRLTRPLEDFTARLTMPFFCPVLPDSPVDPKGMNDPPGSGPYYVAERVVNRRIVLKRNPYYRGERPANVDQIIWTIGESPEACVRAAKQNRIDHCSLRGLPETAIRPLEQRYGVNRPGGQFFVNQSLLTLFLVFNHDRPAFKGPGQIPLKKAINYALDRAALAATFGYLAGRPTDQMVPPALTRDARIYPLDGPDLTKARKELAQSKRKPPTLVFYADNGPEGTAVANVLRSNLKQLGIDLEEKHYASGVLHEKIASRGESFDLAITGWGVDYADAGSFFEAGLGKLRATGNTNSSYFVVPDVTARIEAANRLTGEARRKAWAELDAHLMRTNPPWAPILHRSNRDFVSPSMGCYLWHPLYGLDLAAACNK